MTIIMTFQCLSIAAKEQSSDLAIHIANLLFLSRGPDFELQTVLCSWHFFQRCSLWQQRWGFCAWRPYKIDQNCALMLNIFFLPEAEFLTFQKGRTHTAKKTEVLCSWLAWTLCARCLAKLMSESQQAQDVVFIANCHQCNQLQALL